MLVVLCFRSQVESPRLELVHNIDPWPNNPAKFSTEISAAIRVRDWKLITGDPGEMITLKYPNFR